jgi:hypothetical protein
MADEREYAVGKGKPPQHSRFRKGQSGNPMGRRKGSKNVATLLKQVVNERVTVTENGRRRTITKLHAMLKQLANKAASGDHRAINLLLPLADGYLSQTDAESEKPKTQAEIDVENAMRIDLFRGAYQILADLGVPMPQTRERPQISASTSVPSLDPTDANDD